MSTALKETHAAAAWYKKYPVTHNWHSEIKTAEEEKT